MSIRVGKVVGYGVQDLQHTRGYCPTMTDSRIDWGKFYDYKEKQYDVTPLQFINWMRKHQDELVELHKREFPGGEDRYDPSMYFDFDIKLLERAVRSKKRRKNIPRPSYCIIHGTESLNPRVMVIVPISSYTSWSHYDDILDWIEETDTKHQRNRVRLLKHHCGIFPYNNRMIRFRDPKKGIFKNFDPRKYIGMEGVAADGKGFTILSSGEYNRLIGGWDFGRIPPILKGAALKHFVEDWRPPVPMEVIALLLWTGAFPNLTEFINNLRPMLYVYWS